MNEQMILDELIVLLEAHGVQTRIEQLDGIPGGLCRIRGESILFVSRDTRTEELSALCADAVSRVIDIEKTYLRPEIRRFIENKANSVK